VKPLKGNRLKLAVPGA